MAKGMRMCKVGLKEAPFLYTEQLFITTSDPISTVDLSEIQYDPFHKELDGKLLR